MPELAEAVKDTRAWACHDCGKCTATCPIPRAGGGYSPRRQVLAAKAGGERELLGNGTLFNCLTCGLCDSRCPAGVAYTDLVQRLRQIAWKKGVEPECPHGGALQSVMRMMARGGTQQDRMAWLSPDLETDAATGNVFYWTGCTMYFDALFPELGLATLGGTRAAVRLMNRIGVRPVVSPEERCCGHDLLWNGDREHFELLARHNVELVAGSGAEVLVVSCGECVRTWKVDYRPFIDGKAPRVLHVSEYLAENLARLGLRPGPKAHSGDGRRVTYQDPCRLGRHLGIYEPPRRLLDGLPGVERVEMRHHGPAATCCAGGTWSSCDRYAKKIQVGRLREARATGASVLAAACPKCRIHLRCAMKDPHLGAEIRIEMRDIAELVLEALP